MQITISGPAGVGKGTVARALAQRRNLTYVDAGLLFRFVAYMHRQGYPYLRGELLTAAKKGNWRYIWNDGEAQLEFKGEVITRLLVETSIADTTSRMAADATHYQRMKEVAEFVLGTVSAVVVDGRSAGTALLPKADIKFYLDAPLVVRAHRRFNDFKNRGIQVELLEVLQSLDERDCRDRSRVCDPLCIPQGAHVIDTSDKTVFEVVEAMEGVLLKATGTDSSDT